MSNRILAIVASLVLVAPGVSLAQSVNTATTHSIPSLLAAGFHVVSATPGPIKTRDVQVEYVMTSKGIQFLTGQVFLTKEKEAFICAYEVLIKTVPGSDGKSGSVCWEVK
jgi:hypothetical protein